MIAKELLEILVCPESKQALEMLDEAQLREINQKIESGQLTNRGGNQVVGPLSAALVREDRRWVYPIRDEIPVMLVEEAFSLP